MHSVLQLTITLQTRPFARGCQAEGLMLYTVLSRIVYTISNSVISYFLAERLSLCLDNG